MCWADEAAIAGKVDKEAGKGLSTNDYTDAEKAKSHTHANASVLDATTAAYTAAEKTKLSGSSGGANNYVHPASHSADMISTTASKRFTSDAEMAGKADQKLRGRRPYMTRPTARRCMLRLTQKRIRRR